MQYFATGEGELYLALEGDCEQPSETGPYKSPVHAVREGHLECTLHLTFTFSHLADALIQSDLQ